MAGGCITIFTLYNDVIVRLCCICPLVAQHSELRLSIAIASQSIRHRGTFEKVCFCYISCSFGNYFFSVIMILKMGSQQQLGL